MTASVSVVICAYTTQRWGQLVSAVRSVSEQTRSVRELIVVIDHNEELQEKAAREFSSAVVVSNSGPRGLSGARNTGTAASTGDIVAFLDDDAVAEADWIDHLLAGYDDVNVLGVGGAAVAVWETEAPRWWPPEFLWVVGCSYRGQPVATAQVRNLLGCNMSLRRTVLDGVGGFDSALGRTADRPLGGEETELCIRATQTFPGGRFVYEPKAVVHHWVPSSRGSWQYFRARCRAEGVSKAGVARLVGRSASLSAEGAYTRRVLPAGVVRNLGQGLRGDASGIARAGAIVAGLAFTTTGFVTGTMSREDRPEKRAA